MEFHNRCQLSLGELAQRHQITLYRDKLSPFWSGTNGRIYCGKVVTVSPNILRREPAIEQEKADGRIRQ